MNQYVNDLLIIVVLAAIVGLWSYTMVLIADATHKGEN